MSADSEIARQAWKLGEMFLALVAIQAIGTQASRRLGRLAGAGLSGFIGGLISSTATTAAIAKRSRRESGTDLLEYLAALAAGLVESFVIVAIGAGLDAGGMGLLYGFPLSVALGGAWLASRVRHGGAAVPAPLSNPYASAVRLALLLGAMTAVSHYGIRLMGNAGLYAVTLVASFFEAHAVTISNSNLRASGVVSAREFADLTAISIGASLFSKILLIGTLGGQPFVRHGLRWTAAAIGATTLAWALLRAL